MKLIIDKFYAFLMAKRSISQKEPPTLFVCGEMEESSIFDGIINSYSQSVSYMGWNDRGCSYVTGVCGKEDILSTDSLLKIEEIGQKF